MLPVWTHMNMIHQAGPHRARVLSPPETPRMKQAYGVRARFECDRLRPHAHHHGACLERFGAVGRCRSRLSVRMNGPDERTRGPQVWTTSV